MEILLGYAIACLLIVKHKSTWFEGERAASLVFVIADFCCGVGSYHGTCECIVLRGKLRLEVY